MPAARPQRSSWLHPARQAANEPTHFEPAAEFLEELIEEDRRRARRRRLTWFAGFIVILAAIGVVLFGAYSWTQTRYFVGVDEDTVVIYRGIPPSIGPISLSSPEEDTGIPLADLAPYQLDLVKQAITADSLAEAQAIVENLRVDGGSS
ncbi:MAG: protein phosphatase [Microbacterium sp.]|nr:protein phosphatase [Microbacterium sp.]